MNKSKLIRLLLTAFTVAVYACQPNRSGSDQPEEKYKMLDYVEVGKIFPQIKAPYVIDVSNGNKRIVLIGCEHVRDTTHQQFATIAKYFNDLQPQVAFNEGGQVSDSTHFSSMSEAVSKKGETGCLKYLSDKVGIAMINGDTEDSLEYTLTLQKYPNDKLFLYYVMERVVVPYLYGAYGSMPFEEIYRKAVENWFAAEGFPLAAEERTFSYFEQLYLKYIGVPFTLTLNEHIEKFDYLNGSDCEFCEIGRASKMVRDSVLLSKLDKTLDEYDRIIVTFGHGHALAVEPALKQIVNKKRQDTENSVLKINDQR